MKVVHLCLACFYPDGDSYQENMLPKYHARMGLETAVIASLVSFDENGQNIYLPEAGSYRNEYGIPVTRLAYRGNLRLARLLRRYRGTYEALEKEAPDILFIHGLQFLDIGQVVRYLKAHPGVTVYVDNHADFSNSATNFLSRNVLHRFLWKHCAHQILPFARKFYGVLPARVDFLRQVYGLPIEKTELLVMGADDEAVARAAAPGVRESARARYGIGQKDFLVMTGGKINAFKTQTLNLMEAVRDVDDPRLRLIVFGSVTPELKGQVEALADGKKVQYIGWVEAGDSYELFAAADLACFPGRHSVFWEQVCGQGIPLMVKWWKGTTHVDAGGNVIFLREDSAREIKEELLRLLHEEGAYEAMLQAARGPGMRRFSYEGIARRSIEEDMP